MTTGRGARDPRTRRERAADRRADFHRARIRSARGPAGKLWAACGWLAAEAAAAGATVDDLVAAVERRALDLNEGSRA